MTTPTVLALEGLCGAGKSTLANALAAQLPQAAVAPDYADLAPLPPWPPRDLEDVRLALDHFLDLEQQRHNDLHNHAGLVILDRSPLTLIAHEHGMARLNIPADPGLAARMFTNAAELGLVLVPDGYIHLQAPPTVRAARRARRGPVPRHLVDRSAETGFHSTIRAYLHHVPPWRRLFLDSTPNIDSLVNQAAQFATELPPRHRHPAPSWQCLCAAPVAQALFAEQWSA